MKNKLQTILVIFLLINLFNSMFVYATHQPELAPLVKYEGNENKVLKNANDFYNSLKRTEYSEYPDAIFNTREKGLFKNINEVLSRGDKYGEVRHDGQGFHPNRQIYVFITASQKNNLIFKKVAVYDAESTRQIFSASGSSRSK
jgi:hypothetical protein